MKASFLDCVDIILQEEGGFVDLPSDPGGATNFGITQKTLTRARGVPVTRDDIRALTREEAIDIYHRFYWLPVKGDDLPSGIDLIMFDAAVMSGLRCAVALMQSVLAVETDGLLGPQTTSALLKCPHDQFIDNFLDRRLAHYQALSHFALFGKGWTARIERIRATAHRRALAALPVNPPMNPKETTMDNTQPFYMSRTIWSNFVGLLSFALTVTGHGGFDVNGITDALLQLATAGSFVASTLFRVLASKTIAA